MSSWAISDIHGCAKTFRYLVEEKIGLSNISTLYLLGDYVDRGPDSKGVFDFIFSLQMQVELHCLMGNHEDLMLRSADSSTDFNLWIKNGGATTLESFGANSISEIDSKYLDFISKMELCIELEDYWLVHAGFDLSNNDILENKRALMWKRNMLYDPERFIGKKVIHGHTPFPISIIQPEIASGGMNVTIDAGCVYPHRPGMGNLCALNLDSLDLVVQENIDNIPKK